MIYTERQSLHKETIKLLKTRPRDIEYRHIAEATGIPIAWLEQFVAGLQSGPNVNRVQAVYEFLSGRKLI